MYFGASLGAAVAVTLAVERPPRALILRSPFTSLSDMGRVHYPLLPTGALLRDRFDSSRASVRCGAPCWSSPGITTRSSHWSRVDACTWPCSIRESRLVAIAGADHNDFELLAGPQLIEEVVQFINSALSIHQASLVMDFAARHATPRCAVVQHVMWYGLAMVRLKYAMKSSTQVAQVLNRGSRRSSLRTTMLTHISTWFIHDAWMGAIVAHDRMAGVRQERRARRSSTESGS